MYFYRAVLLSTLPVVNISTSALATTIGEVTPRKICLIFSTVEKAGCYYEEIWKWQITSPTGQHGAIILRILGSLQKVNWVKS